MRRFTAFIIMVVTLFACVVFNVYGKVDNTRFGLEYEGGYEVVYKITPSVDDTKFKISDAADLISKRLEEAEVRNATVQVESASNEDYYQIKVGLNPKSSSNLTNILRSVEAYGKITLSTTDDTVNYDDIVVRKNASVTYQSSTAYVNVDISDNQSIQTIITHAKELASADAAEDDTSASTGNGNIVVWLNKADDDTYEGSLESTNEAKLMQNKILAIVPTDNYDTEKQSLKINTITYSSTNLTSDSAHSLQRVINDSEPNFEIERLYYISIKPSYGINSNTKVMIALGIALVLGCIALMCTYGLLGVAGAATSLFTLFIEYVIFNFFSFQVSPVVIMALVVSFALCANIVVNYGERFKNEIYRGRSVGKANAEARKKMLSSALDSSILVLIISSVTTIVALQQVRYFPIFLIISSICSLIFNYLLFRWTCYWLTNNSFAEKHLSHFMIDTKKIPNVEKQETQTYFGKYKEFDSTKNQKKNFIAVAVALVISLGVLGGLSIANKTFNYTTDFSGTDHIQLVTEVVDQFDTEDEVVRFFDECDIEASNIDIQIVDNKYKEDYQIAYVNAEINKSISDEETIENIVLKLSAYDTEGKVYAITTEPVLPRITFNNSLLLVVITAGIILVYAMIRYRYSMGIASLVVIISEALLSFGLLAISRIPVNSYVAISVFAATIIAILAQIPLFNKIKQLKKESLEKIVTYDQKAEIARQGLAFSITGMINFEIVIVSCLVGLIIISPSQMITLYISFFICSLLGLIGNIFLLIPIYLFLERHIKFKLFKRLKPRRIKKEREKTIERNRRSGSEAQEAIIPGIND